MRFLIPLALAAALPVSAQQMYRCGSSYSDHPCGPGQEVTGTAKPMVTAPRLPVINVPDLPVPPAVEAAAKATCTERLQKDVSFRDPSSVQVYGIRRAGLLPVGTGALRVYVMRVNAKNAYGGYTGEKDFLCLADPKDETVVVQVRQALE